VILGAGASADKADPGASGAGRVESREGPPSSILNGRHAWLQGAPLTQQRTREEKMGPYRKSRSSLMNRLAGVGIVLVMMSIGAPAEAGGIGRYTGRVQSFRPADGVLVVEEFGARGRSELVEVQTQGAEVVRVWRDRAQPWRWRDRPTRLYRWPAGTFLVVIGRVDRHGVIRASRIEIPKPDWY
jgi:hypothetical protein